MRRKCVNYDQIWQNLSTKANHSISPKVTKSVNMVISSKFMCSSFPHFPRHFFHKKCLEKKCSLHLHYPRHFQNVQKKCLAKKCSLHPHVPRHIIYFQKKCLAKSVIYFRTYRVVFLTVPTQNFLSTRKKQSIQTVPTQKSPKCQIT